ncbi:MAG: PH domain-containing protein [Nitrospira sp.]|nr:PH domain-containing protein [Nitrospira sp.]
MNWGLRTEEIPMEKILWLSPETQLERPLPLPWLRWPGGVTGIRQAGDGEVEYMAAHSHPLIVIATPGKMYAISPENPETFLQTFHRQAEVGTLHPISAHSIYPTFLLGNVWASAPARFTIISGLFLSLALLTWIVLAIPTDFSNAPFNRADDAIPPTILQAQLLLLPIINALFFLVNFLLGLFFFRRPQSQPLAYLLWGASVLTSLLFFGAFYTFTQS